MGLKVCGLSLISNMAAGINSTPLSHEEVQQAADDAAERFTALVKGFIGKLG
jgi:purine-nucleoside phosphorylase